MQQPPSWVVEPRVRLRWASNRLHHESRPLGAHLRLMDAHEMSALGTFLGSFHSFPHLFSCFSSLWTPHRTKESTAAAFVPQSSRRRRSALCGGAARPGRGPVPGASMRPSAPALSFGFGSSSSARELGDRAESGWLKTWELGTGTARRNVGTSFF